LCLHQRNGRNELREGTGKDTNLLVPIKTQKIDLALYRLRSSPQPKS
jgi:hypothetical protein